MKFKYIGQSGYKDLDLVVYKILAPDKVLKKGDIIDVPDNLTELIQRIQINGNFERAVVKIPTPKKPKKEIKKEKEEDK